jgi:hypothetical protein
MVILLSTSGFIIFLGCCGLFFSSKPNHMLFAYLIISIGFSIGSFARFTFPIPIVIGIATLISVILFWYTSRPFTTLERKTAPIFPSSIFRLFFLLFSFSLLVITYPFAGLLFSDIPLVLILSSFFTCIACLVSISLSEHPLWVGINSLSITQAFSFFYLLLAPSLLLVGLFSLMCILLSFTFCVFSIPMQPYQKDPTS